MKTEKKHRVFVQGDISPTFIADAIAKHSHKTNIGAHDIFLGQVRSDLMDNKLVNAIEYSCYESMAEEIFHQIRESAFGKFKITCMHIYHSVGVVSAGKICLFVFVSAGHRAEAFEACRWIVEEIKKSVPIWGKELFEDNTHVWKENK